MPAVRVTQIWMGSWTCDPPVWVLRTVFNSSATRRVPDMAVLMRMDWKGITEQQYEQLRAAVNWEGDQPPGGLSHVAAFDADGAHVNDTWASAEELEAFVSGRLMPASAQLGIPGQPEVVVIPAHAVYIPGVTH